MADNGNNFKSYFSHFGLRQICDITLLTAAIILLVGMFVQPVAVKIVGFVLFIVGSIIAIVRMILILVRGVNKSSPEFRNAIVNLVIMSVVFCLSLFGLIYCSCIATI